MPLLPLKTILEEELDVGLFFLSLLFFLIIMIF